jgi:hypothetical protein
MKNHDKEKELPLLIEKFEIFGLSNGDNLINLKIYPYIGTGVCTLFFSCKSFISSNEESTFLCF